MGLKGKLIIATALIKVFNWFKKEYEGITDTVGELVIAAEVTVSDIDLWIEKAVDELIDGFFDRGLEASRVFVDAEAARLVKRLNIPVKFNREILELVNENSTFRGFADVLYKQGYKRSEIHRLKSTILKATYEDWDEKVLRDKLESSFNMSRRRAQLLARDETTRLVQTTKKVYYKEPQVKAAYDWVWKSAMTSTSRESHMRMNNVKANSNGEFFSPDYGFIGPPPLSYNCLCWTEFIKK